MIKVILLLAIIGLSYGDMDGGDVQLTAMNNCVIVYSPDYPNDYPEVYDMKKNIFFPPSCSDISMTFQDTFSTNGTDFVNCDGDSTDRVVFTQLTPNGDTDGQLVKFCGLDVSPLPTFATSELPDPEGGVRIRFRSYAGITPGPGSE